MARNATERLFDDLKAERDRQEAMVELVSYCVACGEPIDYCQGHGQLADPNGFYILRRHHELDFHDTCDPHGCDEGMDCPEGPCAHPSHDIDS